MPDLIGKETPAGLAVRLSKTLIQQMKEGAGIPLELKKEQYLVVADIPAELQQKLGELIQKNAISLSEALASVAPQGYRFSVKAVHQAAIIFTRGILNVHSNEGMKIWLEKIPAGAESKESQKS
jgi:hypothetical protein